MNISLIKSYLPQLVCPGLMEAPCTKVSGALLTEENDRLTGLTCAISSIIALCCYPNVNGAIRNLSLNTPTATIFLQFNYFRENIWVRIWVQFHFLYIFVGRVDRIR